VKPAEQITAEMEAMEQRLTKQFGQHVSRAAIEAQLDMEIQRRIELRVGAVINGYQDDEILVARAAFIEMTKMAQASKKRARQ
jgi:hypothetical protein